MSLVQGHELSLSATGKLEPGIVSSWRAVTPTKYVYNVRSGVKFSDGRPVTAEDVAYSMNLGLDKKLGAQYGYLFAGVTSIEASGTTVMVMLNKPNSLWRYIPASIGGYVYEKRLVSKSLSTYGTPSELPVGPGPYKVVTYSPNSKVVLVPNPYYFGPKPKYSKIEFDITPSPQTLLLALQQGTIDGTLDATTPLSTLSQDATVRQIPTGAWSGLTLDMQQAPFSDIHVRKALYLATDRQSLLGPVKDRTATLANTVNGPTIFYGSLSKSEVQASYKKLTSFPYDLTAAKKELAISSVPKGFTTTLNIPEDDTTDSTDAQIVKQDWAKIGVNLNLKLLPGGPRFQIIINHGPNLGIQIIGNSPDAPDPTEMADEYFSIAQASKGGNNSSNYKNSTVDSLIQQAQESTSAQQSSRLILKAQDLASQDVPVIPFSIANSVMAVHKGYTIGQLGTYFTSILGAWTDQIAPPQ